MTVSVAPHRANQWANCTGSPRMRSRHPALSDERSNAKEDGIAFHHLGVTIIKALITPGVDVPKESDFLGTLSENNVLIDLEMYQAAIDYATDVYSYCSKIQCLNSIVLERQVPTEFLQANSYGKPDCYVYDSNNNRLIIWEAKYGHDLVEVFENKPLLVYACALVRELGIGDNAALTIELRVVQPRGFHPGGHSRNWIINVFELQGYLQLLNAKAREALSDDATCTPGPWCKHCPADYACLALQKTCFAIIDRYTDATSGVQLSDENLAFELKLMRRAMRLLKARSTALETQAKLTVKSGRTLHGFRSDQNEGRLDWDTDTYSIPTLVQIGEALGEDLRKDTDVITPKQAIKRGIDENVIKLYAKRKPGSFKLVEDDGSKARNAFRQQL